MPCPEFVKKCKFMPTPHLGGQTSDEEAFLEPQFTGDEKSDSEAERYNAEYDIDCE